MGSLETTVENPQLGNLCNHQRATILGIGKAVPRHEFQQKSYADYYFEITNSNHMEDLQAKFANICAKTMIEKRHLYFSDDMLRSNPSVMVHDSPSLTLRQELADAGVPELGAEAARNAIGDWGRPATDITHLVLATSCTGRMPGADCELARLLGLRPSTRRLALYQAGCHGGCAALRLAKDLAENNRGSRVLVVCSEVCALSLRGPSPSHVGDLVGQAILGDAAGAAVVGCVAAGGAGGERGVFELVAAHQETVPGTEEALAARLRGDGIVYTLRRDIALHVSGAVERLAERVLREAGSPAPEKNGEVFWVVHPGGRGILDGVESRLGLGEEKLAASRAVMRQYGNTRCSSVMLVMEEMRRRSEEQGRRTAGEGLQWGLAVSYGPGITVETILLRALPYKDASTL
ncbi:hypothetical protein ACP4OV_013143 [Aristida adscensionis]